jgi:hypothetical protein
MPHSMLIKWVGSFRWSSRGKAIKRDFRPSSCCCCRCCCCCVLLLSMTNNGVSGSSSTFSICARGWWLLSSQRSFCGWRKGSLRRCGSSWRKNFGQKQTSESKKKGLFGLSLSLFSSLVVFGGRGAGRRILFNTQTHKNRIFG